MKIKTSELEGVALDWAVAKAVKANVRRVSEGRRMTVDYRGDTFIGCWEPSIDWSQGGPLIQKYQVCIEPEAHDGMPGTETSEKWVANIYYNGGDQYTTDPRPTPLIAACEAIIAAEFGDEIEVPHELVPA